MWLWYYHLFSACVLCMHILEAHQYIIIGVLVFSPKQSMAIISRNVMYVSKEINYKVYRLLYQSFLNNELFGISEL